jgi:hypothetical protein
MAQLRKRYQIADCPFCHVAHAMTVELVLRNEGQGHAFRERAEVQSVCKYTGGAFMASLEVDVPAGRRLGRVRAVSFANG